ncbi:hypothetical protein HDV01_006961 [Terramyces sp. JEL0728]|nr:hypothetical protein HDV01_006961 [Terramyces sp. JEL0728]
MKYSVAFLLAVISLTNATCDKITYRKEVHDLTDDEWNVYTSTIQTAIKQNLWDKFAQFHSDLASQIHWSAIFLPWHRMFIRDVELKLQEINPDFYFPYVDESLIGSNLQGSPIFSKSAAAAPQQCKNRDVSNSYPLMAPQLVSSYMKKSLDPKNGFLTWHNDIEIEHGHFHIDIGGIMSTMSSPSDPLFYSHHGYYDLLWANAQVQWGTAYPQVGGTLAQSVGGTLDWTSKLPGYQNVYNDVFNLQNLCVQYIPKGQPVPKQQTTTVQPTTTVAPTTSAPVTTTTVAQTTTQDVVITTTVDGTTSTIAVTTQSTDNSQATSTDNGTTQSAGTTTQDLAQTTTAAQTTTPAQTTAQDVQTTTVPDTTQDLQTTAPAATTVSVRTIAAGTTTVPAGTTQDIATAAPTTTKPVVIVTTNAPATTDAATATTAAATATLSLVPMTTCAPPLPDFWMQMNNIDPKYAHNVTANCHQVLKQVQNGQTFAPVPFYDPNQLTILQKAVPSDVPQANPINSPSNNYGIASSAVKTVGSVAFLLIVPFVL